MNLKRLHPSGLGRYNLHPDGFAFTINLQLAIDDWITGLLVSRWAADGLKGINDRPAAGLHESMTESMTAQRLSFTNQ